MQKKKILYAGLGTASALVIALLVTPSFIDWSKYQSLAQQKISEATGYELTIGGALRIGFLPSPHANIQNVVLKKPNEAEAFLTLEEADVNLAFLPLLSGRVEVSSVTLEKPALTMVTKKNGGDNWKPKEQPAAAAQVDAVTGEPVKTGAAAPAISVGALKIHGGMVTIRDEAKGTSQQVAINDLTVKADTLTGPFSADGAIGYGRAVFDVDATTGGYRAGETLPVQLAVTDKQGRASLKWSGVVDTGSKQEAQGEFALGYTDLASVLTDVGFAISNPALQTKTQITGMLTASPDSVSIANGALDLAGTRMALKLSATGLKGNSKNIRMVLDTNDIVTLEPVLDSIEKIKPAKAADDKKQAASGTKAGTAVSYDFIPASLEIPADMNADIQIRGKGLSYHEQKTGAFEMRATVANGKGDARVTLAAIPGGGDIGLSASLVSKGVVEGAAQVSLDSLKTTLAGWLKLVDAKTFDNPAMPRRLDTNVSFKVAGRQLVANVQPLSIGETKLNGTIAYTAGARPKLGLKLAGNVYTVADSGTPAAAAKDEKKADAKAETKKVDFSFDPPQLPFDVDFDLAMARLVKGDMVLSDVKAAGSYNGKGINLAGVSAQLNGGSVSLAGQVADLKALSGIDMNAGLATADLEGFVKAVTGTALATPKPVGAFNGKVAAKGDKSKLDVNAVAKAWGFTVQAAGGLDNPFDADIPSTIALHIQHPSFVEAVRTFSPGFSQNAASKPVDVSGTVKISGKTYTLAGLKGVIGSSDIAGDLKADMSGAVPSFSANLQSNTLDLGALVGVDSKTVTPSSSGGASPASSSSQSGAAPWSREPLDTGALRAANLDVSFKAGKLLYGTWALADATADVKLNNGTLKAPISGKLFGGAFKADLAATSAGSKAPLNVDFTANVNKVDIGPFLSALMSSSKKMADGTGSVDLAIKGSGISSAALVSSLAGKADVKAETPIVYGMDIDKLAANIVEAFDGGWKGVLAGFATDGLSGGKTEFKDISQSFPIAGGNMAVKNFVLETKNSNATVVSNGNVNFAGWVMDISSDVKVTQPKDVPVIGMRLAGPLSSPSKSVNSTALDSLVRSKVQKLAGDKVQKLVGDKLGGSAGAIVNQFLGGGSSTTTDMQQQNTAPATNDTTTTTPAPEAAPAQTPQEQLLNGVLNGLMR